ncbi:MAG: chitinase [Clostridia bacterium]|nr:chitinase [Clostridia bacterium]
MINGRFYFSGYATGRSLYDITEDQAKKLTHLNVAFGIVIDGKINIDRQRPYLSELERIRKYNPSLNILLSTGGGDQHGHGPATDSDAHMKTFVDSTMDIVKEFGFDGIDCDWEFPGDDGILEEKYQHTRLFAEYRKALDQYAAARGRKCWLTTAAACGQWYIDRTEIDISHKYLDFINLMTYDLRGWDQPAGHHTCLYDPKDAPVVFSADRSVKMLEKIGVPKEKLLLGAAFYSRIWKNVTGSETGVNGISPTGGGFGPSYTDICLIHEKSGRFKKYYDDTAKAPWLFDGKDFISYDDPSSVKAKCEYVAKEGLGGMMYWEHGSDKTGALFETIFKTLKNS